jgi:Glycosyl hydrolases family 43
LADQAVFTADKVTGPYTLVRSGLRPIGMSGGDFDLCVNMADGKAYQYFERVHSELICADLTEDYTNLSGYYSTHFSRPHPPLVREGPAYFFRDGKHYLASSGTTGYHPNPSEIASADTFHGPWKLLGDLHPSDQSRTSFNSQISSVFKHPGKKDLYIALADRWLPHLEEKEGQAFANGDAYRNIVGALAKVFSGQPRTKTDQQSVQSLITDTVDTSISTYIWLPIRFDGDRPVIEWREQWALTDFA